MACEQPLKRSLDLNQNLHVRVATGRTASSATLSLPPSRGVCDEKLFPKQTRSMSMKKQQIPSGKLTARP